MKTDVDEENGIMVFHIENEDELIKLFDTLLKED